MGPIAGHGLVFGTIILVEVGDVGDQRVIGIRIGEQGANGQENLGDGKSRAPLLLNDV